MQRSKRTAENASAQLGNRHWHERHCVIAENINHLHRDLLVLASDKGLARLEGKDYVMRDGDVVDFRFNV